MSNESIQPRKEDTIQAIKTINKLIEQNLRSEIRVLREQLRKIKYGHLDVYDIAFGIVQIYYPYISKQSISSHSRLRELTIPRQIYHYLLARYTKETCTNIGRMSNRDHSSVVHSRDTISDLCRFDKPFRIHVEQIEKEFIEAIK